MIWAYLIELILAFSLYYLIILYAGYDRASSILIQNWGTFLGVAIALLAMGYGTLKFLYTLFNTEFGNYLQWVGDEQETYLNAVLFQTVLFIAAGAATLAAAFSKNHVLIHITWVVMFYAVVNAISTAVNTFWLIKMNNRFKYRYDRIKTQMENAHDDN